MLNSKSHMPQMSKILKNIWQPVLRLTLDHLKVKQCANKNNYCHQGFMLRCSLCSQRKCRLDHFLKWCQTRVRFCLALTNPHVQRVGRYNTGTAYLDCTLE